MSEYTRRIDLKVEIDLWDWTKGATTSTLNITKDILNFRFQKTIKTPKGSCQLTVLPQSTHTHILDILNAMDVIRISEFGTTKFIGYIQRVAYSGSIGNDGKPKRTAIITAVQFGGLLVDASIGFGMGTALGKKDDLLISLAGDIRKAMKVAIDDGVSFAELMGVLFTNFKEYLSRLGSGNFITYLERYLDVESGLASIAIPLLPRQFELFNGTEQTLTFWQLAEQLVQKPFNELWIDNGPRTVSILGAPDNKPVTLSNKSCLVFRETPFDGTVGGISDQAFSSMEPIHIDADHFLRFDLAKSMDEVYSVYHVKHAAFLLNDITRLMTGQWQVDQERIGKYLFKPLITEMFYTKLQKKSETGTEVQFGKVEDIGNDAALTLRAWFKDNDQYLSGAIGMMVPSDANADPKIGDKVTVHGIEGYFYVEGIAHTWSYLGPLKSDLTVTRGYNRTKKIELKDKIFRRSIMQ